MGETSPIGVQSAGIPAPLAFLRGVLCLDSNYHPIGHCAKLPAYGYAQHPYSTSAGPFYRAGDRRRDDVTIGTIGQLVTRARPRRGSGRDPRRHADLPHRVRRAELPQPRRSASRSPSRPSSRRSPRRSPGRTRASSSFDQYLLRDDPPEVQRLPVGARDLRRRHEAGLQRLPAAARGDADAHRRLVLGARATARRARGAAARRAAGPTGATGDGSTGATGATGPTGSTGSTAARPAA